MGTAFATLDEYRAALAASRLVPEGDLRRIEAFIRRSPQLRPRQLAEYLVRERLLTRLQADYLIEGRVGNLTLANYTLLEVLGAGAMGSAYKARSSKDDAFYVVKIVPRRNTLNLKTIAEKVQALKQVRHPRVSALVNIGAIGEHVYLAWPFLEGGRTLADQLKNGGKLPPRQAAQIALQVASGLQPYHDQGLFHGLLKMSDVLIGADRRVRVLDFGVGFLLTSERGKAVLDTMTNGKTLAHGLDTASPEAIEDSLARSPAGDQYSLGCILYRCLTGQYPFPYDNPVKKMVAHQMETPTPVRELSPDTPPELAAVVERLMAKAPQHRYPDIGQAVRQLQAIASNSRLFAAVTATPVRTPKLAPARPEVEDEEEEDEDEEETPRLRANALTLWLTTVTALSVGVIAGLLTWWKIH
jgi:serine/threonine-protein kinase